MSGSGDDYDDFYDSENLAPLEGDDDSASQPVDKGSGGGNGTDAPSGGRKRTPTGGSGSGGTSKPPRSEGKVSPRGGTSEELQRLKNEIEEKKKQLEEARQELRETEAKANALQAENDLLRKDKTRLEQALRQLKDESRDTGTLQRENDSLREDKTRLEQALRQLKDESRDTGTLQRENDSLREEKTRLEQALRQLKDESRDTGTLQRENNSLRKEKTRLEQALQRLKDELENVRRNSDTISQELQELRKQTQVREPDEATGQKGRPKIRHPKEGTIVSRPKGGSGHATGKAPEGLPRSHEEDAGGSLVSDLFNEKQEAQRTASSTHKSANGLNRSTNNVDTTLGAAFN